jgi:hypothetical protein
MRFNPIDHSSLWMTADLLRADSAWIGHIPFAFFLIELVQPRTLVELGTHSGVSYCAFCQAVKALGLPTRCWAIDTWQGDQHAGSYDSQVLQDLRGYHDGRYGQFSELLQSTFDDAVGRFADGSIDVLHIDGLHTYEAASRDFQTWRSKLSDRAVVLFHDTAEVQGDFGVHRLWAEVRGQFPGFEFTHSHGLGVAAVGKSAPSALFDFIEDANAHADGVRNVFSVFGGLKNLFCQAHGMLQNYVGQQAMINQWRQRVGWPVDQESQKLELAMSNPLGFAAFAANEVRLLINSDLELRARLAEANNTKC